LKSVLQKKDKSVSLVRFAFSIGLFHAGNKLNKYALQIRFSGWSDVFLVSRLSTKRKDTLGNEKQVAGSGWQFLLPAIQTFKKLWFFDGKCHISYREYMVPGNLDSFHQYV